MSEPENKMVERMTCKIAEIVSEQEDENEELNPVYDPVVPIAPVICAHLKLFMSTVIRRMAMHKKKYLLSSTLLEKEKDPKNACSGLTKKVVYDNTMFTAEDFFHMLKDNRHLIPSEPVYNLFIGRLLSNIFVKRSLKGKRALKMKHALKNKEEDDVDEEKR